MGIVDLLRASPLFFELYDKELEKVVSHCQVLEFKKDDYIVTDGEEGDQIFIMLDGSAMVQKETANGLIKIQPLGQGDVFGEMVLMDIRKRSADIVAQSKAYVLEMRYGDIFNLFEKEPKIFGLIMLNFSRLVTKKLRASNDIIVNLRNTTSKKAA